MRPLTVIRGLAWFATMVTARSLMLRWSIKADVHSGPPGQWERHVVGAALLAAIAALALSVSGRKGNPPNWIARGIAAACAAGAVGVAFYLRADANSTGFTHLLGGSGWIWLLAGGLGSLSAATFALALKPASSPSDNAAKAAKAGGGAKGASKGGGKPRKKRKKR
jgi:hypothetical protein